MKLEINEDIKGLLGAYIGYRRIHDYKEKEPLDWQMEDFE